jgi:ABC-2 type transport system permease protein
VYIGVWLAFATLCSVWMRRAATSALVAIGVWLILTLFGALFAQIAADLISPVDAAAPQTEVDNLRFEVSISRLSPVVLYEETASAMLNPEVRSLGVVTFAQLDRAVLADLSLTQSLLLVWQQLVGLAAATVVIFAFAYVNFMRQEVRA